MGAVLSLNYNHFDAIEPIGANKLLSKSMKLTKFDCLIFVVVCFCYISEDFA